MFITERDLQGLYHQAAFHEYKVVKGDRLTPEAKSFLTGKGIKLVEVEQANPTSSQQSVTNDKTTLELLRLDLQSAVAQAYEIDLRLGDSVFETYELLDQEMPPNLHIYSCDAKEVLSKTITKEMFRNPKYKVIILLKKCLSRLCGIQIDSKDRLNLVKVELVNQINKLMEE